MNKFVLNSTCVSMVLGVDLLWEQIHLGMDIYVCYVPSEMCTCWDIPVNKFAMKSTCVRVVLGVNHVRVLCAAWNAYI
jgi:hypothetical protein